MKVVLTSAARVEQAIAAVQKAGEKTGKPMEVVIQPVRESKTCPQNRHVHALIGVMAEHSGQAAGSMKEQMKRHPEIRWPRTEWKVYGTWVMHPKSAADLTKAESIQIIEDLLRLCAEYGVDVPWEHQRIAA